VDQGEIAWLVQPRLLSSSCEPQWVNAPTGVLQPPRSPNTPPSCILVSGLAQGPQEAPRKSRGPGQPAPRSPPHTNKAHASPLGRPVLTRMGLPEAQTTALGPWGGEGALEPKAWAFESPSLAHARPPHSSTAGHPIQLNLAPSPLVWWPLKASRTQARPWVRSRRTTAALPGGQDP
jgi:pyruvate/2-oxoglutarate dehydrogenase complex dihydrolipoamide acyltransferase (E2) component